MADDLELAMRTTEGEGPSPDFVAKLRKQIVAELTTPVVTADDELVTEILLRPEEEEHAMTKTRLILVGLSAAAIALIVGFVTLSGDSDELKIDTITPPDELTTTTAATVREPSVSEDLYGVWLTPDNANHLSLNEDDTWSFSHADDPVDDFQNRGFGPFTFDGELLSLFTDPASKNCSFNSGVFDTEITGTYQAVITPEGNLELTDVDDRCVNRKVEFRGKLSNLDALHQTGILVPYSP